MSALSGDIKVKKRTHGRTDGGAEFDAGVENAIVENAGLDRTDGKCRSGKYRSDNVWKAVKQKIKILNIVN